MGGGTLARFMLATFVLALFMFASASGCDDLPAPQPRRVDVAVVVLDLSASATTGDRCVELVARLGELLSTGDVKLLDVLGVGTGDESSGNEPVVVVPWSRFELNHALFENPNAFAEAKTKWLVAVGETCASRVRPVTSSPIFAASRRGVSSIRAHCAELQARGEVCGRLSVAIHSDFRENGNPAMSKRLVELSRGRSRRKTSASVLPVVDTSGMSLSACGLANYRHREEDVLITPEAIETVWREVLGASDLAFDAACPGESSAKAVK